MREIKFRAWDKSQEQMHMDIQDIGGQNDYFHSNKFVVMQYTGLKDKSGTDIYEGDVVKLDKKQHGNSEWTVIAEVKFDETPLFNSDGLEIVDYYTGWNIHVKGVEIIDNIEVIPLNTMWLDWFGVTVIGNIYGAKPCCDVDRKKEEERE